MVRPLDEPAPDLYHPEEDHEEEMMQSIYQPSPRHLRHRHRRTEDVDYWRKRAGWFDDDEAMRDYNNGVYDTYYQLDDDEQARKSGGGGGGASLANSDLASNAIKALSVLVALGLCFLIARVIGRRMGDGKKEKKSKKRSSSRDRSRSKSRSRSRSRSRKDRDGGYDLMEDEHGEEKSGRTSRRSSRSKSKNRRSSRSRSRARSSSKSRKESSSSSNVEPVLV